MRSAGFLVRTLLAGACLTSLVASARHASAQATAISVSGSINQDFDSMPNSASAALPSGWSFFRSGTSASQPNYALSGSNATAVGATAGSVGSVPTTGAAYLWVTGSAASGTDKAVGFLGSGSYPGTTSAAPGQQLALLFGFTNTSGGIITTLDLAWDYEKYRSGTRQMGWNFYSSVDGSTWTSSTTGDQTYAADANTTTLFNPPQTTSKAVSLTGLSIANGSNYYLRWSYVTTGSWTSAQGLGFDNFTMNPTVTGGGSTDLYWDGAAGWNATAPGVGGSGTWADGSGSWDASRKANFGGTAGTVTATVVTASNGLAFTTSGYTLTGGTITLAAASLGLNAINTGTVASATTSIDSALAGSAGLMKMGQGSLVLGGANTFTGGLTLSSGTLQISSDGNLGDAAGSVTLNGTLKTAASVSLGSGRAVSGGASLDIAPGTTLTVGGSYGTASTTLLNAGTLDLQGPTRSVGTLTFNTAATVNGGGGLTVAGLSATNVTSGSAIVNPAITFGSAGDKTVDVGSGGTLVLPGDIAGTTGRIAKTGAGTLVVSGSNSTSGYRLGAAGASPTNGGTLVVNAAAASGTNQLQFNYGTLKTDVPGGLTFANGLSIGGRAGAVAVLGGPEPLTFTGSSNFFRGVGTSGELRLDVNNVTTLAGIVGLSSGAGTATGVTIGGNGQLIVSGNASGLLDTLTITDTLLFTLSGSIGGGLTMAGSAILDGGGGLMAGNLSFTVGSKLLLDTTNPTLTVNGPSVNFVNFTIANIAGLDSSTPAGSYDVIGGPTSTGTNGLANIGPTAAFDLGDGVSAYFLPNGPAALTLVVVPEPLPSLLTSLGVAMLVLHRRRRQRDDRGGCGNDHPDVSRSGFTLVELLVVIAIIAVLIGLLLPAVQAARESGRRTQCGNNLKQLAVGAQHHVQAQGHFPSGGWGYRWTGEPDQGFGAKQPAGWAYSILPYIEQTALHRMGSGLSGSAKQAELSKRLSIAVALFICPSRRAAQPIPSVGAHTPVNCPAPAGGYAKSDYAANGGDANVTTFSTGPTVDCLSTYPNCSWDTDDLPLVPGVIAQRSEYTPAHVPDGLSNTLLFAEKYLRTDRYTTGSDGADNGDLYQGLDWDTVRTTAITPRRDQPDYPTSGVSNHFGGPHQGSFPAAACDGSVRVVGYDVDPAVWTKIGNRRDRSVVNWN